MKKRNTVMPFSRAAIGDARTSEKKEPRKKSRSPKNKRHKLRYRNPSLFARGVRLEVEGFYLVRLLNELRGAGVAVSGVECIGGHKTRFTVSEKDGAKTFAILEKLCYNYIVVSRASVQSALQILVKKAALIAAVFVFAAVAVFGYGFVWRVEITGCQKTESAVLQRFLKENGVGVGTQKRGVDFTAVRSLVNSFDDILETSVELNGVTLKIEVTETTDHTVLPEPSDFGIFSRYDATVTRVIAESGTPVVHPGSRVFRGATLIGAYRMTQAGEELHMAAVGEVYGTVVFADSFDFSLTETQRVRTGKVWRKTDLSIFALSGKAKDKHNFTLYETESETVYAFQNLLIPLRVRSTVYYEMTETQVVYDLAERSQYYTDTALAAHAIELGDSAFTVTTKLETRSENSYRLHTFIQAELLIGGN